VTQHIHSLRASGVMLAHKSATIVSDPIALRKSAGILCTVPEAIGCRAIISRSVHRSVPAKPAVDAPGPTRRATTSGRANTRGFDGDLSFPMELEGKKVLATLSTAIPITRLGTDVTRRLDGFDETSL
jgi:hypothetical protein